MEVKRIFKFGLNQKRGWSKRVGMSLAAMMALATARTIATADDHPVMVATDTTAAAVEPSAGDEFEKVALEVGKAQKLSLGHKVKTANILNPDIADVVPLGPSDLLVTGKKTGSTQLIVWGDTEHAQIISIEVKSDIEQLRKQLKALFPDANVQVEETGGTLTLHGEVRDLNTAAEVSQLATSYGKVLNFLEVAGGQQVMLKVRFAEVSKQAESQLGFNFGGTDGISVWGSNIGANPLGVTPGNGTGPNLLTIPSGALSTASTFGTGAFGPVAFAYFVNALQTDNVLRLLAEPDLVTTSGQTATFLAGGQFPYPVPQPGSGGSAITIQFQNYGVTLNFTPVVLGNGRIRLHCAPEVSELDYSHSVSVNGTSVPGLTNRNVDTTVELAEGQTLAIGGLLQDNVTATNSQFPVLGDLPVLGALFRSVSYQKNETELVVLVTPVLVAGINPADVSPVPGEHWRDPNMAQLFLMKDLGGEKQPSAQGKDASAKAENPPLFEGQYGFRPAPATPIASSADTDLK